jgi:hypothetical protein
VSEVLHPHSELRHIDDEVGYGVFATQWIPAGTITWVEDAFDRRLEPSDYAGLDRTAYELLEKYTYVDQHGRRVLCWDFARYMNHSCEANSMSPGLWPMEIAVRDVAPGEQLTSDYGALNLERPFTCLCGKPACRGTVRPEDFDRYARIWDAGIRAAFTKIRELEQPLWQWLPDRETVLRAAEDTSTIPSIALNQYRPVVAQVSGGRRRRRMTR